MFYKKGKQRLHKLHIIIVLVQNNPDLETCNRRKDQWRAKDKADKKKYKEWVKFFQLYSWQSRKILFR